MANIKIILTLSLIWLFAYNVNSQSFFEELATEYSQYTVSATDCSKIIHSTGSQIFIPDNAFDLSKVGEVDSVIIFYREIRTPFEMATHQIPMHTLVMGRKYQLESSGMFDIKAQAKAQSIDVHEDRSIYIKFFTKPEKINARTEGYQLNQEKGIWENYSNRIANSEAEVNDNDLWGSPPVATSEVDDVEEDRFYSTRDFVVDLAFQAMEIFDFGIYNYDRLISGEQEIRIAAEFKNQDGEVINGQVYIIYDDINTVYYFNQQEFENDFFLLANREYSLFTVDNEGRIARLIEKPNLQSSEIKEHAFLMSESTDTPKTQSELKSLMGL